VTRGDNKGLCYVVSVHIVNGSIRIFVDGQWQDCRLLTAEEFAGGMIE
jgi:hypothetical protein